MDNLTESINARNNMLLLTHPSVEEIPGWSKHTEKRYRNSYIVTKQPIVAPEVFNHTMEDREEEIDIDEENNYFDYL